MIDHDAYVPIADTIAVDDAQTILELSLGDYSKIRQNYVNQVFNVVSSYLINGGRITSYKNTFKAATATAFLNTADVAWEDGGGTLPLSTEALKWYTTALAAENGYIDLLFESLKALRVEEADDLLSIAPSEANRRALGYADSLDGLYSQIKVMAHGNKMLTFVGQDGKSPYPCPECRRLKGKRHRASWWVAHDLVPYRGNSNFTCGCYRCQHILVDDAGYVFSL